MKITTSQYEAATKDVLLARDEEGKVRTGWLMHEVTVRQDKSGLAF